MSKRPPTGSHAAAMLKAFDAGMVSPERLKFFVDVSIALEKKEAVTIADVLDRPYDAEDPLCRSYSGLLRFASVADSPARNFPKALLVCCGREKGSSAFGAPLKSYKFSASGRKLWEMLRTVAV